MRLRTDDWEREATITTEHAASNEGRMNHRFVPGIIACYFCMVCGAPAHLHCGHEPPLEDRIIENHSTASHSLDATALYLDQFHAQVTTIQVIAPAGIPSGEALGKPTIGQPRSPRPPAPS